MTISGRYENLVFPAFFLPQPVFAYYPTLCADGDSTIRFVFVFSFRPNFFPLVLPSKSCFLLFVKRVPQWLRVILSPKWELPHLASCICVRHVLCLLVMGATRFFPTLHLQQEKCPVAASHCALEQFDAPPLLAAFSASSASLMPNSLQTCFVSRPPFGYSCFLSVPAFLFNMRDGEWSRVIVLSCPFRICDPASFSFPPCL